MVSQLVVSQPVVTQLNPLVISDPKSAACGVPAYGILACGAPARPSGDFQFQNYQPVVSQLVVLQFVVSQLVPVMIPSSKITMLWCASFWFPSLWCSSLSQR